MDISTAWQNVQSAAREVFEQYRESNPEMMTTDSPLKYVDRERALEHTFAKSVLLTEQLQPCFGDTVFEIGPGAGYFLYIADFIGHCRINGCDIPNRPLYRDVHRRLGIDTVKDWTVKAFEKIGAFDGKYDLIVGTQISWMDYWFHNELQYFLSDCREHLNDGGRIVLFPNPLALNAFKDARCERVNLPLLGNGFVFGKEN